MPIAIIELLKVIAPLVVQLLMAHGADQDAKIKSGDLEMSAEDLDAHNARVANRIQAHALLKV